MFCLMLIYSNVDGPLAPNYIGQYQPQIRGNCSSTTNMNF